MQIPYYNFQQKVLMRFHISELEVNISLEMAFVFFMGASSKFKLFSKWSDNTGYEITFELVWFVLLYEVGRRN